MAWSSVAVCACANMPNTQAPKSSAGVAVLMGTMVFGVLRTLPPNRLEASLNLHAARSNGGMYQAVTPAAMPVPMMDHLATGSVGGGATSDDFIEHTLGPGGHRRPPATTAAIKPVTIIPSAKALAISATFAVSMFMVMLFTVACIFRFRLESSHSEFFHYPSL